MGGPQRKTLPVLEIDHSSDNCEGEWDEEKTDYKVEKLIAYKHVDGVDLYQVRWEGFASDDDTWEPADNLPGFEDDMLALKRALTSPSSNRKDSDNVPPSNDGDNEYEEDDAKLSTLAKSQSDEAQAKPSTMLLPQLTTPNKRRESGKRAATTPRVNTRGAKTDNPRGRKRTKILNENMTPETHPGLSDYQHKETPPIIELTPSHQLAPPLPHRPDAAVLLDQTELRRVVREEIASCANLQALKTAPTPSSISNHGLGTGGEPKVLHVGAAPTKAKAGPWTLLQFPGGEEVYVPCERAKTTHTAALVDYLLERIRFSSDREDRTD